MWLVSAEAKYIKKILKNSLLSSLNFDESNVPQSEEKWATATNYLLRKKNLTIITK
jgi:hypothetical protein